MRIYTKRGDQGKSSLFGGPPVSKADIRLEAYGTLDELNATIGLCCALLEKLNEQNLSVLNRDLFQVQNYLFTVGSHLALGDEKMRSQLPPLDPQQTEHLEKHIDEMGKSLSPLKNFILPGGTELASQLHVARTVARRAERRVVESNPPVHADILVYLNRLSDFLFVAARFANARLGQLDILWEKK